MIKLLFHYQKHNDESIKQVKELFNNPVACDVVFKNCDDDYTVWEAEQRGVTSVPVSILYSDDICVEEIARWKGFVDSETINKTIEDYETKHMV